MDTLLAADPVELEVTQWSLHLNASNEARLAGHASMTILARALPSVRVRMPEFSLVLSVHSTLPKQPGGTPYDLNGGVGFLTFAEEQPPRSTANAWAVVTPIVFEKLCIASLASAFVPCSLLLGVVGLSGIGGAANATQPLLLALAEFRFRQSRG
jgi:hypothetical protein